jgi:DNA invertase Pin-like site-specific DNA recombinase
MTDMRNRVRAVEASRMSKLVGPKDQAIGLMRRSENVQRYCDAYGLDLIDIAEDTDVSGSTDPFERKGLGSWLARPGDWDVIIATDLDRIGRNARHLTHLRDWCDDNGKRLIILSPHLEWPPDPDDVGSPIMWDLLGRLAEAELKAITKRNRDTRAWLQQNGRLAGKAPYGYRIVGPRSAKTLEIDPVTGPIVREAATRYLAGETLREIADDFNARGLPSRNKPTAKFPTPRWHPRSVGRVLREATICGRLQQGDHTLKFPGIITVSEYRAILKRLDEHAHRRGIASGNKEMLTGILFCGYCGKGITPITAGQGYRYYYDRNTNCPHSPRLTIPLKDANEAVSALVEKMLSRVPVYRTEITPGRDYEDEIDQLKLDYAAIDPEDDPEGERAAAIRAEIARLRELPTVPPEEKQVPVPGEYVGAQFARKDTAGKRETLLRAGVKVYVTKTAEGWDFRMTPEDAAALRPTLSLSNRNGKGAYQGTRPFPLPAFSNEEES